VLSNRAINAAIDYFGAKYYSSDISVWLSVDPLSDMYPSTSPFAYVENNPIMFVDPNGMYKDPAAGKADRDAAVNRYGESRVGPMRNLNEGTDKDANYGFNVYKDGEDKHVHKTESGAEYGYIPQEIISDNKTLNLYNYYSNRKAFEKDPKAYIQNLINIEKEKMVLVLKIMKNNELLLNEEARRGEKIILESKRVLTMCLLGAYSNGTGTEVDGSSVADLYFPASLFSKIDNKYDSKAKLIIKEYNSKIEQLNAR